MLRRTLSSRRHSDGRCPVEQRMPRSTSSLRVRLTASASTSSMFDLRRSSSLAGRLVGRQVRLAQGREAVERVPHSVRKGNSRYVRHFITNDVIEPSAEGATGKVYLMFVDCEEGQPSSSYIGVHYEDVYVKTPA